MAVVINRKADFSKISGDYLANECSPVLDGEGIAINLPERVPFGQQPLSVPMCGAYRLPYDTLDLRGNFVEKILFVAVACATHRVHANRFVAKPELSVSPAPIPQPPPYLVVRAYDAHGHAMGAEQKVNPIVGSYFNTDLAPLLQLPATPAEYIVYALLGPIRSNALRVQLV